MFQFNNVIAKAEGFSQNTLLSDEYVENNVEYKKHGNSEIYKITLNDVIYELTYDTTTELLSTKAISVVDGRELDIEQLKEQQQQNGEVLINNSSSGNAINKGAIQPMIAIPLIPIATWVFEHLIALAIAATIVSVVVVTKDKVKSELISRFKDKNPTFIYRTGSGNGTNLTPRSTDNDGLSYTLTMPSKSFTATTMEAVNKTKVLKAIKDKPNHVAVLPTKKSDLKAWQATRDNAKNKPHKYTKILQSISVRVK